MNYFIHVADPSFFEAPWPGERRLGPFSDDPATGSKGIDAAKAQVVSDLALGQMAEENFIGIYDEENSEARRVEAKGGRSEIAPSRLKALATTKRNKIHAASIAMAQEQVEIFESILPPGVSLADVTSLADHQRRTVVERAREDADAGS